MKKKMISTILACTVLMATVTGCGNAQTEGALEVEGTTETAEEPAQAANETTEETPEETTGETAEAEEVQEAGTPKYVFLFIGDGMSYPQMQLTNYYLSASNQEGAQTVR